MATTVQLDQKTKAGLDQIKLYPNETYDSVIKRLINIAADDEGPLSKQTIKDLEEAIRDVKAGRVLTDKQVKKKHGL